MVMFKSLGKQVIDVSMWIKRLAGSYFNQIKKNWHLGLHEHLKKNFFKNMLRMILLHVLRRQQITTIESQRKRKRYVCKLNDMGFV